MKKLCVLLALLGCSETAVPIEDASVSGDSGVARDGGLADSGSSSGDAGATRTVEIGTGTTGFEPITEGQTLPLLAGPQGGGRNYGYNLSFALRVRGYNPRGIAITYRTLLASNREVQAEQMLVYDLVRQGDAYVIYGSAPQIMDCCAVEDLDVIMRAEVMDADGLSGSDERRVHAGPVCAAPGTSTSICP